jgi:hypothetical protein
VVQALTDDPGRVKDDEGYLPVDTRRPPPPRPSIRTRLTSPWYWLAILLIFGSLIAVISLWGDRWALLVVVGGPFLLVGAERLIWKQDD